MTVNEDVLNMIDTLHARLDDVREAVESLDREAPGFAKKLDRIDDSLYLVQRELEALASSDHEERADDAEVAASDDDAEALPKKKEAASDDGKGEILSDDMKENLVDAGRALGNIYRDGKEVVTELSGAMGDLKDVFSFGKKRR